jgi:signal transduction histidine kinase
MPYFFSPIKCFAGCSLLLLFFVTPAYAQPDKVADIEHKLKQPLADTARLTLLMKLSDAYTSVDLAKKFYYANRHKQLAEKLHIDTAIADAYISMGVSYGMRSIMDSALYYFGLAYKQAAKTQYLKIMGKSLSNTGFVYDRLDDKKEAISHYFRALEYLKKSGFTRGVNQCLINIGSIYYDLQQYKLAESYYLQCLKSYKETRDEAGIGYVSFTLGDVYQELGQTKKAMDFLNRSLAIRKKLNDPNGIAMVQKAMGQTYIKTKQYDLSVSTLKTALASVKALKMQYEEAAILLDLTDAYLGKKDYNDAKDCALQCLAISRVIKSKSGVSESLSRLVTIYRNKNDIAKAFEYQSQYVAAEDSVRNEKALKDVTLSEISRVRTENASLEKNNKIITKKNTNIATKLNHYGNAIMIGMVVLVFVILLLFILYRRNIEKQATNKLLLKQKEEIAQINKELETLNEELKTQMELTGAQNTELERLNMVKNKFFSIVSHDLRSPLATLQTLFGIYHDGDIGKDEFNLLLNKLEDTILSTGAFLDNLLEWSKSQLEGIVVKPVSFNINDCIAENIQLFDTKIGLKNLDVVNRVSADTMVYADRNMINLVIRNLLSNSIKFCKPGDGITFSAEIKHNRVMMAISDTGPGISSTNMDKLFSLEHTLSEGTQGEKGNNLGLILCRDMISQNNGSISFETKQGEGTTFWIELPAVA